MRKFLFIFITGCFSLPSFTQYNFGFEEYKPGTDTLVVWNRKSGPSYYGPVADQCSKSGQEQKRILI